MEVNFINKTLYTGLAKDGLIHSYNHFFPTILHLTLCGVSKEDIIKVKIDKLEIINSNYNDISNEKDVYFGILDLKTREVNFIFPSILATKICSNDFFSYDIENGLCSFVKIKFIEVVN